MPPGYLVTEFLFEPGRSGALEGDSSNRPAAVVFAEGRASWKPLGDIYIGRSPGLACRAPGPGNWPVDSAGDRGEIRAPSTSGTALIYKPSRRRGAGEDPG